MKKYFLLFSLLLVSFNSFSEVPVVEWQWSNLLPTTDPIDDPFKKLTKQQLDDLGFYVGLKEDVAALVKKNPNYTKLPELKKQLIALDAVLTDQGVDIDFLLSQRQRVMSQRKEQATSINKEIINEAGVITGFVIPIVISNKGITEFFLIKDNPLLNLSHNHSAPAPNQVIYVSIPTGLHYDVKKPIALQGMLREHLFKADVTMPDGHRVAIESRYQLISMRVEQSNAELHGR